MGVAKEDQSGRVPGIIQAVGWLFAIASILCFGVAKPEQVSMFDRMIETGRDGTNNFDPTLVRAALGLDVLAVLIGFIAMALNIGRPGGAQNQVLPGLLVVLCIVGIFVMVPRL